MRDLSSGRGALRLRFCSAAIGWLAAASAAIAAEAPLPYRDVHLEAGLRAQDLVGRLTPSERIAQLGDNAPAVPRLGISAYNWWSEGLHGIARDGYATVFPQAIGLAASWDTDLLDAVGATVAEQARTNYAAHDPKSGYPRYAGLTIWSPNVNIFRDPRWGRGQETYGEDPYLTSRLAVSFIHGLQGDDPLHPKVIATPKHFAVHSGPEPLRHGFDVHPSAYDLEDTYLPAFRAALVEGQAQSVMCAYNSVDGIPACANPSLFGRLRQDWGFRGFVVSDCDAIDDMTAFHHYSKDDADASAAAFKAGTDLNCGIAYRQLGDALKRGLIDQATLDQAAVRLFSARIRLGQFDPAPVEAAKSPATPPGETRQDRMLALRAAQEAMVLLKNRHDTLPLRRTARVAVIGPTAELLEDLEANYHGTARAPVTPLAGMRQVFGGERIRYAQGSGLADGVSVMVPSTALRTDTGQAGLIGEYFDGTRLDGQPRAVRIDPTLAFDFDHIAPIAGLHPDAYAVRWHGQLLAPADGDYRLGLRVERCFDCSGHDRVRLYLDGKLLRDGVVDVDDSPLHLGAGPHALRVELIHSGQDQGLSLQWQAPVDAMRAQALAAARGADAIVAFVGLSPNLEGEQLKVNIPGFDGGDRTSLDLPAAQERLLKDLQATGKPLIVVLQSGSAVALNWADKHADAILAAWYPGEAGGLAIAQTLVGDNNPAGRLPITVYRSVADLPPFDNYSMQGRSYRYFSGSPLYAFGQGLSYADFHYHDLRLSQTRLNAGDSLDIGVQVSNDSDIDGDEVVEVYLQPPSAQPAPLRQLVGFTRIHLQAGERRQLAFTLDSRRLSGVDAQGLRAVRGGHYTLTVGGGQPGHAKVLSADFDIQGEQALAR